VLITTWASDRIEINVTPAARPRFLVLNELYQPDWIAEIGGRTVTVHPTNVVMRGVLMLVGADRVRFTFQPFVRPATMVLFAASALITAYGVAWLLRHERQ
jgi:hypothetical protein